MSSNRRRGLLWRGLAAGVAALALIAGGSAAGVAPVAAARGSGAATAAGGSGAVEVAGGNVAATAVLAEAALPAIDVRQAPDNAPAEPGTVQQEAVRSGGYRSPSGSFSGGAGRSGTSIGGAYRTGQRAPSANVTRTPRTTSPGAGTAYTPGRAGSFIGGLATGAILGHLLNPFSGFGWGGGYGYGAGGGFGFGFSIISLLIWAVLLYAAYRIIRRLFRGRGGGRYR